MQKIAKKLSKNTIISITQPWYQIRHIIVCFDSVTSFSPWYKTPITQSLSYIDIHTWYKRLFCTFCIMEGGGGGAMFYRIIFLVDYIVENDKLTPK